VLANKQHNASSLSPSEVAKALELERLPLCRYTVRGTSAVASDTSRIVDVAQWLLHVIAETEKTLRERVENEKEVQQRLEAEGKAERLRRVQDYRQQRGEHEEAVSAEHQINVEQQEQRPDQMDAHQEVNMSSIEEPRENSIAQRSTRLKAHAFNDSEPRTDGAAEGESVCLPGAVQTERSTHLQMKHVKRPICWAHPWKSE